MPTGACGPRQPCPFSGLQKPQGEARQHSLSTAAGVGTRAQRLARPKNAEGVGSWLLVLAWLVGWRGVVRWRGLWLGVRVECLALGGDCTSSASRAGSEVGGASSSLDSVARAIASSAEAKERHVKVNGKFRKEREKDRQEHEA
eukprot:scaffold16914_cov89-Isochrysis_galbana.AAC.1